MNTDTRGLKHGVTTEKMIGVFIDIYIELSCGFRRVFTKVG